MNSFRKLAIVVPLLVGSGMLLGEEAMLVGDWVPGDVEQIDYRKLPKVPGEHAIISDVRDRAGTWVHQHAYLAHHAGRYWAMWSDGPGLPKKGATAKQHRNIVPGHDQPGTRVSYATSKDGLNWSKPKDLSGPPRIEGYGWIARGLWIRDESRSVPLGCENESLASARNGARRFHEQFSPEASAFRPMDDDPSRPSAAGIRDDRRRRSVQ